MEAAFSKHPPKQLLKLEIWSSEKALENNFPWASMQKKKKKMSGTINNWPRSKTRRHWSLDSYYTTKKTCIIFSWHRTSHTIGRPQTEDSWDFPRSCLLQKWAVYTQDNRTRLISDSLASLTLPLILLITFWHPWLTNKLISQGDNPYLHPVTFDSLCSTT